MKAIFLQFDDVIECVNELKNKSDDSETLSDCDAVLNEMFSFEFIVAIHVRYNTSGRRKQPFELYEELQLLKTNSLDSINDTKQLIQYILENNLEREEIYPNVYITIRIMLTVPVSTASVERSFAKLKLIKTYLRRTMSKERPFALSVVSIEAEIVTNV
ncbi:zinc finger MYM-type protein 1 [Trichonephila clavipes]|nr:zinc finger MYM-type protein 1 [Trichonephila clavipes]